jgi:hypothetical protein
MANIDIRHDEERGRFVADLEGEDAYLEYSPAGEGRLDFTSTFVPPSHRHQGIGERIVKHALAYARERGYEVIPTCPFVRQVIEEHPEYLEG